MPEITSVDAVRRKLREFDKQMAGAVEAAEILSRARRDAESILARVNSVVADAERSLGVAKAAEQQQTHVQGEWNAIRTASELVQNELESLRRSVATDLASSISTIEGKLTLAQEKLDESNILSLANAVAILAPIQAAVHSDADDARRAAMALSDRLTTIQGEIDSRVTDSISVVEQAARSQINLVEDRAGHLFTTAAEQLRSEASAANEQIESAVRQHATTTDNTIRVFMEEVSLKVSEHQRQVDKQVADFLARQNLLVQNLSQQIDSASVLSKTFLETVDRLTNRVEKAVIPGFKTALNQLAAAQDGKIKALRGTVQDQAEQIKANSAEIAGMRQLLEETIEKLKKKWIGGIK